MRARQVLPAGTWDEARETDRVVLDYDRRHRRRISLCTAGGRELLIDLERAAHLRQDDGLLTENGVVRVVAAPERLIEIRAPTAEALVRIAWHLGNRHLPVQLSPDRIHIRADHVIAAMVEGLGGGWREIEAAFDPEPGAYAGGGYAHHHA